MRELKPPAKFVHDEDGRRGMAISSLVSGDCIVSGASLKRSLIFTGARINSYSTLERGRDAAGLHRRPNPSAEAMRDRPRRRHPGGLVVGEDPELDAKRFRVSEKGICLITQPMIDRLS